MCWCSHWRAGPKPSGRGNTGGSMNIAGECKVCGHIYDMTTTVGCPACRALRVAEMFKPIDPLMTALGAGYEYMRGSRYTGRLCTPDGQDSQVPEGCKMPQYADDQIYELRRMFRL